MMAERLLAKEISIDLFISSPAMRAITTAGYFAEAYQVGKEKIKTFCQLYHAPPAVFYEVAGSIEDRFNTVAIFSHNPGITTFVNELTNTRIDNMPTCAVFAVSADIAHWRDFESAKKSFWFFDYPKL
jgi:phosphohistidine phosphatase